MPKLINFGCSGVPRFTKKYIMVELLVLGFVVVLNIDCKSNNFSRVSTLLGMQLLLILFVSSWCFWRSYWFSSSSITESWNMPALERKLINWESLLSTLQFVTLSGKKGLKINSTVNTLFKGVKLDVSLARVSTTTLWEWGIEAMLNATKELIRFHTSCW